MLELLCMSVGFRSLFCIINLVILATSDDEFVIEAIVLRCVYGAQRSRVLCSFDLLFFLVVLLFRRYFRFFFSGLLAPKYKFSQLANHKFWYFSHGIQCDHSVWVIFIIFYLQSKMLCCWFCWLDTYFFVVHALCVRFDWRKRKRKRKTENED